MCPNAFVHIVYYRKTIAVTIKTASQFVKLMCNFFTCFIDYDDISNCVDFIICLGGDGTLLYASSLFQVWKSFLNWFNTDRIVQIKVHCQRNRNNIIKYVLLHFCIIIRSHSILLLELKQDLCLQYPMIIAW